MTALETELHNAPRLIRFSNSPQNEAVYLREMASSAYAGIGHTMEGQVHVSRLRSIADMIECAIAIERERDEGIRALSKTQRAEIDVAELRWPPETHRDWETPYTPTEAAQFLAMVKADPGPWSPRIARLALGVIAQGTYAVQLEDALTHVTDTQQYPAAGCDACAGAERLVAAIYAKRVRGAMSESLQMRDSVAAGNCPEIPDSSTANETPATARRGERARDSANGTKTSTCVNERAARSETASGSTESLPAYSSDFIGVIEDVIRWLDHQGIASCLLGWGESEPRFTVRWHLQKYAVERRARESHAVNTSKEA